MASRRTAQRGLVWARVVGGDYRRVRLRLRRGVELPVLLNRDEPIISPVAPNIDASLELLGPMDQAQPPPPQQAAGRPSRHF